MIYCLTGGVFLIGIILLIWTDDRGEKTEILELKEENQYLKEKLCKLDIEYKDFAVEIIKLHKEKEVLENITIGQRWKEWKKEERK